MPDPIGAAIAFSALGANVLATALLLLFNHRSRAVRWYSLFLAAISAWLLSLGILSTTGDWSGPWASVYAAAVFALPGLFLAATLSQRRTRETWASWGALAVTAAAMVLGIVVMTSPAPLWLQVAGLGWQVVGWGTGSWLQWRARGHERPPFRDREGVHRVVSALLVLPGLLVAGAMLLDADAFLRYVMPLLIFVIHIIIFVGVVWLRFYDIEIRAARSGEIAGRAVEAERLAAVGELAASVAHEVRNPLTGVRSLAQQMAEQDVDPERCRRYAGVIVEEIGRVDRIVANLLGMARRGAGYDPGPGPTPLAPLFDDLLLLTGGRARRAGVSLEADAAGSVAPAPREPLAQVLLNLLLNAIQHSPDGGTVQLRARSDDVGVTLVVRDSGPGIPSAERERIFEPFHSAGTDGTGLGLSIVRRIARERTWTLSVDDAPGGGAEFRIEIAATSPGGDGGSPTGAGRDGRTVATMTGAPSP
ncbi:MAG: ATP-binding protein [Gemmatimonadota bacterium]